MSVVTAKRAIIPTIWPGDLGRASGGGYDKQVRAIWRFVPDNVDDMCDWATVVDDTEDRGIGRRLKHLVYRGDVEKVEGGDLCTVTLILQGFLGNHALSTLGNWKGREKDASSAVQYLVLESGGIDAAFGPQVEALDNIRQLICMHAGAATSPTEAAVDTINLRRPVFTKVRAVAGQDPAVPLTDANDPHRAARKIAARWRVDHNIATSIRRKNGTNMPVAFDALSKGDFVEVTATATIEVIRTRKYRGWKVSFIMHDVVRLWTAKEAKAMLKTAASDTGVGGGEAAQLRRSRVMRVAPAPSSVFVEVKDVEMSGEAGDDATL